MSSPILYDDTYKGPRWRYGLTLRPIGSGTPDNWIVFSDRPHPQFAHGTIDYPRELPPRLVEHFSLTFVKHIASRGAPIDYTPIAVGMTVVRRADRAKPRPVTGTVERFVWIGPFRDQRRAVVRWHGVWGAGRDHHSKVKAETLMRWTPESDTTASA